MLLLFARPDVIIGVLFLLGLVGLVQDDQLVAFEERRTEGSGRLQGLVDQLDLLLGCGWLAGCHVAAELADEGLALPVALQPHLEGDLVCIEVRILLKLLLVSIRGQWVKMLISIAFSHRLGVEAPIGPLRLELLDLRLYRLSGLRFHEGRVRGPHLGVPGAQVLLFGFSALAMHVVGFDELALEKHLEDAGVEDRPWRNRIILVTEVIPFVPFVDEDLEIGRLRVQSVEELVQVASGVRRLQINDDVDPLVSLGRHATSIAASIDHRGLVEGGRRLRWSLHHARRRLVEAVAAAKDGCGLPLLFLQLLLVL